MFPDIPDSMLPASSGKTNAATPPSRHPLLDQFEAMQCRVLWCQLREMGLFEVPASIDAMLARAAIVPACARWFGQSLHMLEARQYLHSHDGQYHSGAHPQVAMAETVAQSWLAWDEAAVVWLADQELVAKVRLTRTMLAALPGILRGEVAATDIMFPDASVALVEGIYKHNAIADYFNQVLADALLALLQQRWQLGLHTPVRLLEIGAGTGGTSARLFALLRPFQERIAEYCYTDLSKAFLFHAGETWGKDNPYLCYRVLDIAQPLAAQAFEGGTYDIVIATNVMHATRNVRNAVRNAKALLRTHGVILLNEIVGVEWFTHLTFGLLEGWWLYEDAELRVPGCPALTPASWQALLQQEGFLHTLFPAQSAHGLGQQVILAESDGVVRQLLPVPSSATASSSSSSYSADVADGDTVPDATAADSVADRAGAAQRRAMPPAASASPAVQDCALPATPDAMPDERWLQQQARSRLRQLLGTTLRVPEAEIETHVPLARYGLDSILIVQLTNVLRKIFPEVGSTLFFECASIDALANHFMAGQPAALAQWIGVGEGEVRRQPAAPPVPVAEGARGPLPATRFVSGARFVPALATSSAGATEVAIIGLAGRYAGAGNMDEFWQNLANGVHSIQAIPASRWDMEPYFDAKRHSEGKSYSKWAGLIDQADCFDPLFFNLSPREAEKMSPQERLFLEQAHASIEDAAYTPATLAAAGKVGVFVGVMNETYAGGARHWSVANRVSYLFDFHGPSLAVDTACSSSLSAIHLALESLAAGTCEVAIAGGVNLILDPSHLVGLSAMSMLSGGDACKSFGAGADGFVDGEGVGAIVLKPLEQARLDGDHIYAVIKGSMLNAAGKTNGYTVPNPQVQAQLVRQTLQRAGVDARDISYVEAHGTGTALGDPIEVAGLSQAFAHDTADRQFCALGSAKSNIGHCESAAGIAGLSKVLLQMKHQQLVPSLHARHSNPEIDFTQTPFVLQQTLTPWLRPVRMVDGISRQVPRMAGLSSFGAGGANAHIVLQEYPAAQSQPGQAVAPVIIVLSARTGNRLHAQAQQLLAALEVGRLAEADLPSIAWTLQAGREAMEERLAAVVDSLAQLRAMLADFCCEEERASGWFRGQIKGSRQALSHLEQEDLEPLLNAWISAGKLDKLPGLWVKGVTIDWRKLYPAVLPARISLPTYPFLRERYWLDSARPAPSAMVSAVATGVLHPLLHRNTSDLQGPRFSSIFDGSECFLADHVVNGRPVLPGVAYLEMARVALLQAAAGPGRLQLNDTRWLRPLLVAEPVEMQVELAAQADGSFTLAMLTCGEDGLPRLHATTRAVLMPGAAPERLDLAALQQECGEDRLDGEQCYLRLQQLGFAYGPSQRALHAIHVGANQVLAQLQMPATSGAPLEQFGLHPALLDAALQAPAGFADAALAGQIWVPSGLEQLELLAPCQNRMWALVRINPESSAAVRKLDIDLCDDTGLVCVRMRGFASRLWQADGAALFAAEQPGDDHTRRTCGRELTRMWLPQWQAMAVAAGTQAPGYGERIVIICGIDDIAGEEIRQLTGCRCIQLASHRKGVVDDFARYCVSVFEELKWLLQASPEQDVLFQVVIPALGEAQVIQGLHALLKTAELENPRLRGQLLAVEGDETAATLTQKLQENALQPAQQQIRYLDQQRQVASWQEPAEAEAGAAHPWRSGGVYLITGGAGGVGLIVAREIASQVPDATLILAGRSARADAALAALREAGCVAHYRQVEVSDKAAVQALLDDILSQFGQLNGILHAAGVVQDNYIVRKPGTEVQAVLAPKVAGLVNLDQASAAIALDLFLAFSSVAAVHGNPGQADYAAANAFMDAYAAYRSTLVALGLRHGHTLSVNWPLWRDGGMQLDAAVEQHLLQQTGMVPISGADAMAALYCAFGSGAQQVMLMRMQLPDEAAAPASHAGATTPVAASVQAPSQPGTPASLSERATGFFTTLLSRVIKLPSAQIDIEAGLEKYGIDSIMAMGLTNQLEQVFGPLSKTLLFEYQSIQDLIAYFVTTFPEKVQQLLGPVPQESAAPQPAPLAAGVAVTATAKAGVALAPTSVPAPASGEPAARDKVWTRRYLAAAPQAGIATGPEPDPVAVPASAQAQDDPVAIIGLAGRYPQAENMQAFWNNLKHGKDCITEVPQARWDHAEFFDPVPGQAGKSYGKWGGFLDDVDAFDPVFFNIPPRHADFIDPQERLFLQCAWETLEDAGYTREALARQTGGNVGVFVGVMYEEYQLYGVEQFARGNHVAVSSNPASVANRVSYFCNFHGPSMAVNTMCSSSLTALHLACQAIRNGDCEMALAGGVNVSVHPNKYLMLSQGRFISGKGQCESFGEGGDGYVPAEGVGAVLLKPLSKAVADGDRIYGLVKGLALNHGGKTNGYTVPNPVLQGQVVQQALDRAGVTARQVSYVEAHGTGTSLGDPIEIAGLSRAFRAQTQERQFCAIGSAKSNIGHCESAAGIAALSKVLLQLRHRQLVPSLHSAVLNPHIDFANSPFVVQQTLAPWPQPQPGVDGGQAPRIAGISSFGAGGSNAHVIIEEYLAPRSGASAVPDFGPAALIVLSAKNESGLQQQVSNLLAALSGPDHADAGLFDIAYTLQTGREPMEYRLALLATSRQELLERLQAIQSGADDLADVYRGDTRHDRDVLGLFASDEDMAHTIDAWIAKGKMGKLLSLWVRGLHLDWARLYPQARPRRIGLPTYPFARERYWVAAAAPAGGTAAAVATGVMQASGSDQPGVTPVLAGREAFLLRKGWQAQPVAARPFSARRLLLLAGSGTLALAREVQQRHAGSLLLDMNQPGWAAAVAGTDWAAYDGWIDFIGCGAQRHAATDWLIPLQNWVEARRSTGGVVLGLSAGLECFCQARANINLSGAERVGLYRMLQSEYSRLKSRHVDLEPGEALAHWLDQIDAELASGDDHAEVCYRANRRYHAQLQGEVPAPAGALDRAPRFEAGQVLLITGGTRGIGLLCAHHFVQHYGVRRLVLTGREALPPPETWRARVAQAGPGDALGVKLAAMLALQDAGVLLQVMAPDLSDRQAMQACIAGINRTLGPVAGVIHSAGLAESDTPVFVRKSQAALQAVLQPKVSGLDTLLAAVREQPLQMVLLFSSVSALLPALGAGQSDYAMANAYMDYVAQAHARNYPLLAIQWPSWKETGIGEIRSAAYLQTGLHAHTNAEGLALLDHLLCHGAGPVVLPAMVNPELWQPALLLQHRAGNDAAAGRKPDWNPPPVSGANAADNSAVNPADYSAAQPVASSAEMPSRRMVASLSTAADTVPASLLSGVTNWLIGLLSDILRLDARLIEGRQTFLDHGADSVLLLGLIRQVATQTGAELDPSILFQYPTIEGFAKWLCIHHGSELAHALAGGGTAGNPATTAASSMAGTPAGSIAVDAPAAFAASSVPAAASHTPMPLARSVPQPDDAIAVVGMACSFPQAANLAQFWQLLRTGRSALAPVPVARFGHATSYSAGLLASISEFDPAFFNMSLPDAKAMDPQALLVLEQALSLFCHAGYSMAEIKGQPVGVYLGARSRHWPDTTRLRLADNPVMAVGPNYLAANVSQFFDLHGPSLVLDTACSSALVGMQMAIQSLLNGDIRAAVVGGVNLLTSDAAFKVFAQRAILGSEFHIFDQRAQGAVLGEGAGMVMLKTLAQAQQDGDRVYAVVRALSVNNDGRTVGPAAPNFQAQKAVMHMALQRSGIGAGGIGHIEVNGSGSEVTDLLELRAIESVYRSQGGAPCSLGSVKPNIGHPLCAEGIASFIKVVLMLHHGELVPFLSGQQPSKHFKLDQSPFYFCRQPAHWQQPVRIAAINCFADGGTNAHVILQAAPGQAALAPGRNPLPEPVLSRIELAASGVGPAMGDVQVANEANFWGWSEPGNAPLAMLHPARSLFQ